MKALKSFAVGGLITTFVVWIAAVLCWLVWLGMEIWIQSLRQYPRLHAAYLVPFLAGGLGGVLVYGLKRRRER